jgi:phage terminase large subunit
MRQINPNFTHLVKGLRNPKVRGAILKGSSRSGKTISSVDFIIWYCTLNNGKVINIVKETYNEFKTTLYDDFKLRLNDFGLENPFERLKEVQTFTILGNKINFLGADQPKKFHGAGCDLLYFNEILPIPKTVFDQAEMRCRDFFWGDFNPSTTVHWVYDSVMTREDITNLTTTFKDNPFISKGELNKILSYDPENPINVAQGTADKYMHDVYALGIKGEIKGAIYTKFELIERPEIFNDGYFYGLDFGYTVDPLSLVRYKRDGNNIYTELLIYEPIAEPQLLIERLKELGIENYLPIICDSSDRYVNENGVKNFVKALREADFEAVKVSKKKNKMFWIGACKIHKINVIKNNLSKFAILELENYKMAEIQGIGINKPEDKNDHFCDAFLYPFMMEEQENKQVFA